MMERALAIALAASLALAGLQTWRLSAEEADHDATKLAHAEQIASLQRAAIEAHLAARAEEKRRAEALQGVIDETEQKLAQARSDAGAAADAGQRLRAQLAAITASCRGAAGSSGVAGAGAPAEATSDLLADVQRRLDEAADGIARHADEARAAGQACERSYRALTAGPALER